MRERDGASLDNVAALFTDCEESEKVSRFSISHGFVPSDRDLRLSGFFILATVNKGLGKVQLQDKDMFCKF